MKHAVLTASAALALVLGGPAMAESNNLASVESPQTSSVVRAGGISAGGGSKSYPTFDAAHSVTVTAGTDLLLPTSGSEGISQTAASLPHGFSDGTVSYAQAQSVARFLAEHEGRAPVVAQSRAGSHRG